LATVPEDPNDKNNKVNHDTKASIKEQIIKKRQEQIKNNKKTKNPYFVKFCKFTFYLICLISLYIVIKKILEKYGFIINQVEEKNNLQNNNKSSIKNGDEIPLKQFEITEIKSQNKED